MKLKTAAITLIALGIALLIYALLVMDISTGGGVINLDLMNTRQNLVTLGALVVLAGVILLATSILATNTTQGSQPESVPVQDKVKEVLAQIDRRLIMKSIGYASLVGPAIGGWIISRFFFGPIAEASFFDLIFGIALFCAPFALKKYR